MPDPDLAALRAVRTALEQALDRLTEIADERRQDEDDPYIGELDELERSLLSVVRRMDRTLRRMDP